MRTLTSLLAACLWTSCGSLAGCGAEPQGETCDTSEAGRLPSVQAAVYLDGDRSDRSVYGSRRDPRDTFLKGVEVSLLGGEERTFTTCGYGFAAFGQVEPGLHLVTFPLAEGQWTTSRNLPQRLPGAVRAGAIRLVAIGDSLPVMGAARRFPELVAERLGELGQVTLSNLAEAGSTTEDWLPGQPNFEASRAALAEADLLLVSLGGNDVLYFADEKFSSGDMAGLYDGLLPFLTEVLARIRAILAAVRVDNPSVDVAWLLYPNYGRSERWGEWVGEALQPSVVAKLDEGLTLLRDAFSPQDRILLVDVYQAWAEVPRLDDYLIDELHFNPAGHDLVADEFLKALGGARLDGERPFGAKQSFGLSPDE
ncbi:MAG TPA: SGNH/GDSL hydrolase family protein [Myxococcota bacterium]|nr:SGNH/GDSL hydrolase family protein [Myxococcota bacterium]HRY97004.1 SGNH/GDSL hydrolase family protein [Myxococcota bacterium]HSA21248.1 SGNH/GDSL hydrolase family protein [Myxococcota bacterium]